MWYLLCVVWCCLCGDGELMMRIVNTVIVMLFVLLWCDEQKGETALDVAKTSEIRTLLEEEAYLMKVQQDAVRREDKEQTEDVEEAKKEVMSVEIGKKKRKETDVLCAAAKNAKKSVWGKLHQVS